MNASGVISGTPTVAAASNTYTITGTNAGGSSTTTLTFSVFISYKWTGTTTAWSTASNWESNTVPTTTSDITIPNTTNKPTLSANTTVASVAFSGNNQLILGSFNLTTNSLTGGSSTAYVVTDGTGSLTIKALPTATATTFPIGSSTTSYDPLSIQPTSSVDVSARVKTTTIASDFTSTTGGITDINKVAKREWNITPTGTPGSTVVTFTNGGTVYTPTTAKVGHYTFAATNPWEELAATYAANVWTTTTSSFSPFGIGSSGGFAAVVLPVELLSFKGKNTEGGNFLTWTTANEVNNKGFDVERLMANGDWETLGFVKGNDKASTYQYIDDLTFGKFPTFQKLNYYRLSQIDNDGKETLSKVITIESKVNSKLKVYPNPVYTQLTIETEATGDYQILNILGQIILRGPVSAQRIDVSALTQDNYVLKVGGEQVKFSKQ